MIGNTYPAGNSIQLATAGVSNYRGFCGDFDRVNRVFVIVHGNGPVGGLFLDDDGNPIGAGFTLPTAAGWSQLPRVSCSNEGSCLAVWHDGRAGVRVYGRVIRFTAGGVAQMGADFLIGGPSWQEAPPGIAYSPDSGEYLVSWSSNNTYAQRVSVDGQLRGGTLTISGDNIWTEQSSVAYSPVGRNFAVITMKSLGATQAQIFFRTVAAGSGALGNPIVVDDNMAGGKITDLEWDSGAQKFFGGWFNGGGFTGALISSDGSSVLPSVIFPGFSSYDGFDMAFNEHTQTIFSVFHGPSAEDWGAELDRQFQSGNAYEVTSVGAANGAFVPKIVAHPFKPFWIVITTRDYGALFVQKVVRE